MTAVQSWINKGTNPIPDWATAHLVGRRDPNGSIMITTLCGKERAQARCHTGMMLIERQGVLYTRHPSEAKAFLAEMDDADRGSAHLPPVGPSAGDLSDVADRTDDTDDISRRIAASRPAPKVRHEPPFVGCRTSEGNQSETRRKPPEMADRPADRKSPVSEAPRRQFAAAKGMPPSIENRRPEELNIDDTYQRSIDTGPSRALITSIAANWDWRMCMPLVVSKRADGSLYVIDGQHRHAGAMLRNQHRQNDIPFLPCCVGVYDSIADEAAMFVAMNRSRRAINRLDDFHAALAAGDMDIENTRRLIEGAGFTVARTTGSGTWRPGEVAFTSSVASVSRKHGDAHVSRILTALASAFPGEVLTSGGALFMALSRIIVTPPPDLDVERLFIALKKFDAAGWASLIAGMKGGTDRAAAMREALLMAYAEVSA